jgi:hypothetical protein
MSDIHDPRVDALTADVITLKGEVRDVVNTVKSLAASTAVIGSKITEVSHSVSSLQTTMREDIKALGSKQAEFAKTNWPVLIGIMSVTVTIIALGGSVLAFALRGPIEVVHRYQERAIEKLERQVEELRKQ